MFKLRMEVADVLQAEYEATDAQKALLKEAVGTGYGAQESGKRLLICTSPRSFACVHTPSLAEMHARAHGRKHAATHARTHACTHARTEARRTDPIRHVK